MSTDDLEILIAPAVDQADPDIASLIRRVAKWQRLFSSGTDRFTLDGFADLFDEAPSALLVYDDYADSDTRWLGFERYRQTWEREINQNFPGIIVYRIELDRAETSGDVAWTAFTWFGRIALPTGIAWPTQHATHIWRRTDGIWRIIHEHLTSGVKESGVLLTQERRIDTVQDGAIHKQGFEVWQGLHHRQHG